MYASIHRYLLNADSKNDLRDIGWRLGAALADVSGFVAAVSVDDDSGALVTVSLFDDADSLDAATPVTNNWTAEHRTVLGQNGTVLASGEVVAQKGL